MWRYYKENKPDRDKFGKNQLTDRQQNRRIQEIMIKYLNFINKKWWSPAQLSSRTEKYVSSILNIKVLDKGKPKLINMISDCSKMQDLMRIKFKSSLTNHATLQQDFFTIKGQDHLTWAAKYILKREYMFLLVIQKDIV